MLIWKKTLVIVFIYSLAKTVKGNNGTISPPKYTEIKPTSEDEKVETLFSPVEDFEAQLEPSIGNNEDLKERHNNLRPTLGRVLDDHNHNNLRSVAVTCSVYQTFYIEGVDITCGAGYEKNPAYWTRWCPGNIIGIYGDPACSNACCGVTSKTQCCRKTDGTTPSPPAPPVPVPTGLTCPKTCSKKYIYADINCSRLYGFGYANKYSVFGNFQDPKNPSKCTYACCGNTQSDCCTCNMQCFQTLYTSSCPVGETKSSTALWGAFSKNGQCTYGCCSSKFDYCCH